MKRLFVRVLTVGLVASLPFSLLAADRMGQIEGKIIDKETGEPLAFVNVIVRGSPKGAATDLSGRYLITGVPEGKHKMLTSMIGYGHVAKEVQVAAGEKAVVDFELTESPIEMAEVVVTGTRTPRYIKEVPVRTEVVTSRAIRDKAACSIYEVLEGEPGVRVEQQCQACNYSVVRLQGLGPDHTQVLVDGQPMYTGLAGVYGLQQIGTAGIDRIEIVKGAGSALYGSNSIAGAINLITARPGPKPRIGVRLQYGSYGTTRLDLSASSTFDNIGFVIYALRNSGDPIDQTGEGLTEDEVRNPDGLSDRVMTDVTNVGFTVIADNLAGGDELTVRARSIRELRCGGVMDGDLYKNPFTQGTERILTNRYEAEGVYRMTFSGGREARVTVAYARHERDATNDTFLGDYADTHDGELPPVDLFRPYIADEHAYTTNLDYSCAFGKHHLLCGLQYSRNQLDESGMYVIVDEEDPHYGGVYRSTSDKHADDVGLYLQDEYAYSDAFELVAGVRFDSHNSEDSFFGSGNAAPADLEPLKYDENSVNPRIALRYQARPCLYLRASLGTGFRVPYGFSEDLHLCSGSPRVWKGPGLKPEESRSVTLSADYDGEWLALGVNIFHTYLEDKIGLVDAGYEAGSRGYTYEWKNIDDAWVHGVEFNAAWRPVREIDVDANVTINNGEYKSVREDWIGTPYEEDSKCISRFPRYTAGLDLTYTPRTWTFVLGGYITGPMHIDYYRDGEGPTKIQQTDPFLIANAKVSKRLFGKMSLYVGGRNLTDYLQPERHTDDAAFMYAPVYGRMIYAGVEM